MYKATDYPRRHRGIVPGVKGTGVTLILSKYRRAVDWQLGESRVSSKILGVRDLYTRPVAPSIASRRPHLLHHCPRLPRRRLNGASTRSEPRFAQS